MEVQELPKTIQTLYVTEKKDKLPQRCCSNGFPTFYFRSVTALLTDGEGLPVFCLFVSGDVVPLSNIS